MAGKRSVQTVVTQLDRIEKALASTNRKIDRISRSQRIQTIQGENQMALDQDIFDAIAAQSTVVDSLIEYIRGLVASNVISQAEGEKILADIKTNNTKLEGALLEGVPPAPPA